MRYLVHLTFAFFFFLVPLTAAFGQGDAPALIQGQSQTTKSVGVIIKVPNKQATKLNSSTSLLETGNTNLLENPGFEHATGGTGWTITDTGTAVSTVTYITSTLPGGGAKMANISCAGGASGGTCSFKQSPSTGAAIDSSISAFFYSANPSAVTLYSLKDGSRFFNTTPTKTSEWQWLPFQQRMGTTSTGIEVLITVPASTTYVVNLDNMNVGFFRPTADVSQSRFVGSLVYTANGSCTWLTTSTSFASFSANASCPTATVKGNAASAPGTKIPGIVLSGDAGTYQFVVKGRFQGNSSGTAIDTFYRLYDGTTGYDSQTYSPVTYGSVINKGTHLHQAITYTAGFTNRTFEVQAKTSNASNAAYLSGEPVDFAIEVYYYPPASGILSWKNRDTEWTSFTPTGSWSTNTTYTGRYRRDRDMAEIQYYWLTSGAPTSAALTLNMPSGLVIDTAKLVGGTKNAMLGPIGLIQDSGSTTYDAMSIWKDTTSFYVTVGGASATYVTAGSSVTQAVPITWGASDYGILTIKVPIVGWDDRDLAVVDLSGLQQCEDTFDCTDTFSLKVNTNGDAITDLNVPDWVTGPCTDSDAGESYCTFKAGLFTVAPNCTCTIANQTSNGDCKASASTSGVSIYMSVATNYNVQLVCHKTGADYIGKTAKAVASDQNIRTPGNLKVALFHAEVSSSDVVSLETSDWINGDCTNATTGEATCNFVSNTFTTIFGCWTRKIATSAGNDSVHCNPKTSETTSAVTILCKQGTSGVNYGFKLFCLGVTP